MKNRIIILRSLLALVALSIWSAPARSADYTIKAGSTDVTVYVFLPHGFGESDAGECYYIRNGANAVPSLSTELASGNDSHSDGKWKQMAGDSGALYRIDLPDAAVAAGARSVNVVLINDSGAMGNTTIDLVGFDPTDGNRLGLAYLPSAAPGSTNGLLTYGTGTGQLNVSGGRGDADALRLNGDATAAQQLSEAFNDDGTGGDMDLSSPVIANATQLDGSAQSLADLKDFADTGYDPSTHKASASLTTAERNAIAAANKQLLLSTTVSSGTSTSQFTVAFTSGTASSDMLLNAMCIWRNFTGDPETRRVVSYVPNTGQVTVSPAFSGIPSASHQVDFFAVPRQLVDVKDKTDHLPNFDAGEAGGLVQLNHDGELEANITGNLSGSVGSVTGAVGSVTGAVGSVTAGVGLSDAAITEAKIATGAIDADAIADDAKTELQNGLALEASVQDVLDFFDGAPTFAEAMDDHHYTTDRADKLDNLDVPVSKAGPSLLLSTTIAEEPESNISLVLANGPAQNNALNGALVVITAEGDPTKKAVGLVKDYDETTETLTLVTDPEIFTFADGDTVDVIASGSPAALWLGGSP